MKKRILLSAAALLCLALLAGCRLISRLNVNFDGEDFSKAQKIVVTSAAGDEKAVLTEEADIDAFVKAVNVEGWHLAEQPENPTPAGAFTLWQTETVTALMDRREAKETEICTFRIYQEDYITIEIGGIDLHFSVPRETGEYLRELAK